MNASASRFWPALDHGMARLRLHRRVLTLVLDALLVGLAWNLTYLFRSGFEHWLSVRASYDGVLMLGVMAVYAAVFHAMGVPRQVWRFTGFEEIKRIGAAVAVAGACCALVILLAHWTKVSRAVLIAHPLMVVICMGLARVFYRMLYEHARARITGGAEVPRVLVLGAGDASRQMLGGVIQQGWQVLGVLDDDPTRQGVHIAGVPVLGRIADLQVLAQTSWGHSSPLERASKARALGLPEAICRLLPELTHWVVALPGVSAVDRRHTVAWVSTMGLPVLTMPSLDELSSGESASRLRAIEPDDLLGRDPVLLDEAAVAEFINGHTVLVTGAGGSIGSELCRQIVRYGPARLILYELSEFALYQIDEQLRELQPQLPIVPLVGDVRDAAHLDRTWQQHRPQVVFHAAAFKHVPLMEADNAWMALQNNTLGTWQVAQASAAHGVERVVLISTDKAVNPTNVMGASKRGAEMLLSCAAALHPGTRFMAVRFGNVLGSSGSVIPKFKAQIEKGGPITVTHPEITRYFMTIPEASRLVLQAAALAQTGQVYVLDMGHSVRIVDLAQQLIVLSGHRVGSGPGEIAIRFSGLRPGEKLYEELLADADLTLPSAHPRLRIAQLQDPDWASWGQGCLAWLQGPAPRRNAELKSQLERWIPSYRPSEGA